MARGGPRARRHAVGADRPHQPACRWRNGARWGVTDRDGAPLEDQGVPGGVVLPMGRKGPAFIAYANYDVYLEWNQSFVYTLTAAHLADRLAGAPAYRPAQSRSGACRSTR